ncbi:MAG: FAD-dependent monooxygenase [Chloroflexota bacterium]|nr:FAD-dependent monooxygenase [Chloroflexota bacterium]
MATSRVIVIGGGIGGLAAGIALQRAGIEVEVYERTPELQELGAGLSLWANAIKVLDKMGVAEVVRALSAPGISGGIRSAEGEVLVGVSASELRQRFGEVSVVVHRAELQEALFEVLGREHVHLGAEFTGFTEEREGVTAHFADGRRVQGDALIGADGIHSRVRAQIHGDQKPIYAGYTAWRAVVPFDHQRLLPGESWGSVARFGQLGMSDGRVYWFATRNAPEGARSPDGEKAELLRTFRGWHAPIEALIKATDEAAILRHDIYDRPTLERWGNGRVTLLGDAAHPMTPNLGQGACQALEDAVVLAESLSASRSAVSALRAYEARRVPRANAIVKQSRRLGQVGQWQGRLALTVREMLLRKVVPLVQSWQAEQILGYEV